MDAWLLGCASCGFRDYCVQNAYRQYHKVDLNKLAVLELDSDDLTLYRNQKNIIVSLPINENGDCADFRPMLLLLLTSSAIATAFMVKGASTAASKKEGTPTKKHKLKASFAPSPVRGSGKN